MDWPLLYLKTERTAKSRDGQNKLSTLAPKHFSPHLWPQCLELALGGRVEDFSSPRSASPGYGLGLEGLPEFVSPLKNVGNWGEDHFKPLRR